MKKINLLSGVVVSLVALAVVAAWVVFNWQALGSLHLRWIRFDEPYAVGYPAVALALWWVWRHREKLWQRQRNRSVSAVVLLLLTLAVGATGQLVHVALVQQLVALGSAWLALFAVLGWSTARFLIFPFVVVSLGIPVWDFLVDPLRIMTVWFAQHMLDVFGIPAHVDGFLISLPTGTLEVAGGCSGLNLLLAMLLVGLLFAESHRVPRLHRVLIVVLAAAIGIVDNWVRVFVLIVIAHRWGLDTHLVQHHGSLGWWIYAGGLVPYFWLAGRIERASMRGADASVTVARALSLQGVNWPVGTALLIMALLLIGTAGVRELEGRRGAAHYGFAMPAGGVPLAVVDAWLPAYSGQDITQAWQVSRAGVNYEVVALTYIEQHADKKLIYFSNRIAEEKFVLASGQLAVEQGFAVKEALLRINGSQRLVWWYWWVDGETSISPLKTKLLQLRAVLFGDPSAAVITVMLNCESDCRVEQARSNVAPLLSELRRARLES
ncbi:MAG: exosortase/archaeosortase family protein [Spongiibacteraceae bacterium]